MRFYKLNIDITDKLQRGLYTRTELGLDEYALLGMLERKDIDIVDEPVKCELVTANGFRREITLPDFIEVINTPVFESISFHEERQLNDPSQSNSFSKNSFVFLLKVRGENKFIYEQR